MGPGLAGLLDALPGLRVLVPAQDEVAIGWVHSSDLVDPAPFLEPGTMLLTTGTQFDDEAAVEPWVEGLRTAGVVAVGFGTEVVRATPQALVRACERLGMPLVEIPYAIPFIAVIRAVADAIAARARERDSWSLAAQRALSVASLGNGGLDNVLRTLAVRLDGTVLLFGADGGVRRRYALRNVDPARLEVLERDARRLLGRGGRASGGGSDPDGFSVVHTIGRTAATRAAIGMIAPGTDDAAARAVITSAVAIAEITLDRDAEVSRVAADLGARSVRALAEGRLEAAAALADAAGRPLPADALVAVGATTDDDRSGAARALADVGLVAGIVETQAVAIVPADWRGLEPLAIALSADRVTDDAGVPISGAFDRALGQALVAARTGPGRPGSLTRFTDEQGAIGIVLAAVASESARVVAEQRLAEVDRGALDEAVVWFDENGQWEPAARRLGLHRHVLRRHVEALADTLGIDIGGFGGRAELWALLVASGRAPEAFRSAYTPR
jgi:PucR family transcriptional regulator, purine catabolism regulatory protein